MLTPKQINYVCYCNRRYHKMKQCKYGSLVLPNDAQGRPHKRKYSEIFYQIRASVLKRDGYQCQICFIPEKHILGYGLRQKRKYYKGGKYIDTLCVHHIDYNKNNNDPKNLVALCPLCHSTTNGNTEYWIKYFNNPRNKLLRLSSKSSSVRLLKSVVRLINHLKIQILYPIYRARNLASYYINLYVTYPLRDYIELSKQVQNYKKDKD